MAYSDTKFQFRSDYDAYLARTTGPTNQSQGGGLSSSANATQSDSSGKVGQDISRTVFDGIGKKAAKPERVRQRSRST